MKKTRCKKNLENISSGERNIQDLQYHFGAF